MRSFELIWSQPHTSDSSYPLNPWCFNFPLKYFENITGFKPCFQTKRRDWSSQIFLYNNSPAHQARNRFGDWRWFDVEGWRMESWPSPPYWNYVPLLKASEQLVVEGWKRREKGPCTLDNMGIFRKQWRVEAQVVFVQDISMIWRIFLQVDHQEQIKLERQAFPILWPGRCKSWKLVPVSVNDWVFSAQY